MERAAADVEFDLETVTREEVGVPRAKVLVRAHADDRVPAQDGDVDQARVVAIDEDAVGELARSAEVLAAEPAQGVEVLDFLQSNDIRLERANELARDFLGDLVEDCEIRLATSQPSLMATWGSTSELNLNLAKRFSTLKVATRTAGTAAPSSPRALHFAQRSSRSPASSRGLWRDYSLEGVPDVCGRPGRWACSRAITELEQLICSLDHQRPGDAASPRKSLAETLTVARLGSKLLQTVESTNPSNR
jgi:hypothetical protein